MKLDKSLKQITCILPKGKSRAVLVLLAEKGIFRANATFARGFDIYDPLGPKGKQVEVEKEMVTVVVEDSKSEEVFDYLYYNAGLDQWGGGMIFLGPLNIGSIYELPTDLPWEMSELKRVPENQPEEVQERTDKSA